MKACVIGLGSIGTRHEDVLTSLGVETVAVSRRPQTNTETYTTFDACWQKNPDISYVIIANETSQHMETLINVRQMFAGKILVEKPLCSNNTIADVAYPENIYVAYNLRFHPIIQRIKTLLEGQQVLSAHIYVGQNLSTWRPGTDYSTSYSADRQRGGGVLRDLSHELDYAIWLFGEPSKLAAVSGKFSDLRINSDDICSVLYQSTDTAAVSINMNYIDHISQRQLIINTNRMTINADLVAGVLRVNDQTERFATERNTTYIAQHQAMLHGFKAGHLCTLAAAKQVQNMIDEIETKGRQ